MRNIMYLRPGNMYKDFSVEESVTKVDKNGRPTLTYSTARDVVIRGCLSAATTREIARFAQLEHPITHTVVQNGRPKAKADDKLHFMDRTFLIKGIDEAGSLGACTIYYVQERADVL